MYEPENTSFIRSLWMKPCTTLAHSLGVSTGLLTIRIEVDLL